MSIQVIIAETGDMLFIKADGRATMPLRWDEANQLQRDLHQACIDANIDVSQIGLW